MSSSRRGRRFNVTRRLLVMICIPSVFSMLQLQTGFYRDLRRQSE